MADVVCGSCGDAYGAVPVGTTEQCDWISHGERCELRVCPRGFLDPGCAKWMHLDGVATRFCREHVGPGFKALYALNVEMPGSSWEKQCDTAMKKWKRGVAEEKKKGLAVIKKKKSGPRFKDIPHQTNVLEK